MRKITPIGSRQQRRIFTAAAMTAAAAAGTGAVLSTPSAHAGLMMDLRAVALNGVPMAPTKQVLVGPGDVLTLDLFAVITGTNGLNDEATQNMHGSLRSSGTLLGNLSGGRVAPFNAAGSQDGSQQDIDGDTDLDIGAPAGAPSAGDGYFIARSDVLTDGVTISPNTEEVRVGTFNWTVTGTSGDYFLNFVRRTNASGGNISTAAVWREDGLAKNPTLSPYTVGAPVVMPEPAGVAVAAIASLGLLARRRGTTQKGDMV
jgi:hypothetical protein